MSYRIQKTLILIILGLGNLYAQSPKVHSHNDYEQDVPFWKAFSAGANSIEVDVFLKNDSLYATHSEADIQKDRTIERLYLQPLKEVMDLGLGDGGDLQLLIDIKSDPYKTLDALISALKEYPELIHSDRLTFCISGNEPKISDFTAYPGYIFFDYQQLKDIPNEAWKKVALISLDFGKYATWNGNAPLKKADRDKILEIIARAHAYHKPFRFWGTPDGENAWQIFSALGVDFLNTDHPYPCVSFAKKL